MKKCKEAKMDNKPVWMKRLWDFFFFPDSSDRCICKSEQETCRKRAEERTSVTIRICSVYVA